MGCYTGRKTPLFPGCGDTEGGLASPYGQASGRDRRCRCCDHSCGCGQRAGDDQDWLGTGRDRRPCSGCAARLVDAPARRSSPALRRRALPVSVACPSVSLCVAVDSAGRVATSTDPTGGFAAWTLSAVDPGKSISSVSCPTTTFCAAVDQDGNVLTSTNPAGGVSAWKLTPLRRGWGQPSISCPSASLCVIVGARDVAVSTDPAAGGAAWTVRSGVDHHGLFLSVACPSASLCVASDNSSYMFATTDPVAGAWTATKVSTDFPAGLSCPSVSLCVAGGYNGVVSSTDPGHGTWHSVNVPPVLFGMSCASASLCVGVGDGVLVSTNPTGSATAWTAATTSRHGNGGGVQAVSCPTASLCVAVDRTSHVVTSTDPGGQSAWKVAPIGTNKLGAVSCPTVSLCVAGDYSGNVIWASRPTGTWAHARVDRSAIHAISCPVVDFCLGGDTGGGLLSSTNPRGNRRAWKRFTPPQPPSPERGSNLIYAVSCYSKRLCAAVDLFGACSLRPVRAPAPRLGASPRSSTSRCSASRVRRGGSVWPWTRRARWRSPRTRPPAGARGASRAWMATGHCSRWRARRAACAWPPITTAMWSPLRTPPAVRTRERWPTSIPTTSSTASPARAGSLCVAVDSAGNVVSSTNPAAGAAAWTVTRVDTNPLYAVSCASRSLCVAVDDVGNAVLGRS